MHAKVIYWGYTGIMEKKMETLGVLKGIFAEASSLRAFRSLKNPLYSPFADTPQLAPLEAPGLPGTAWKRLETPPTCMDEAE